MDIFSIACFLSWFCNQIQGDTAHFAAGGLVGTLAYAITRRIIKNKWGWLIGLIVAGLAVAGLHAGYEAWYTWWNTPLGPSLQLVIPGK